jgi:hypothetical protein
MFVIDSQIKKDGRFSFWIYLFRGFFSNTKIKSIFSIQYVQTSASFYFSIEFEFDSIEVACNVIQYFHLNGT